MRVQQNVLQAVCDQFALILEAGGEAFLCQEQERRSEQVIQKSGKGPSLTGL